MSRTLDDDDSYILCCFRDMGSCCCTGKALNLPHMMTCCMKQRQEQHRALLHSFGHKYYLHKLHAIAIVHGRHPCSRNARVLKAMCDIAHSFENLRSRLVTEQGISQQQHVPWDCSPSPELVAKAGLVQLLLPDWSPCSAAAASRVPRGSQATLFLLHTHTTYGMCNSRAGIANQW